MPSIAAIKIRGTGVSFFEKQTLNVSKAIKRANWAESKINDSDEKFG